MKTYLIIGAVVVVAAVGGVLAFSGNKSEDKEAMMESGEHMEDNMEQESNASTMRALLAVNEPQKCEFSDSTEAGSTVGVVYVAKGKMRGDFVANAQGQTFNGHMIIVNNTIHSWTDSYPNMGVKISMDASATSQNKDNQSVDPDKEIDYKCEDWSVDESKFTLPAGVTFNDMSSFMVPPAGVDINQYIQMQAQ